MKTIFSLFIIPLFLAGAFSAFAENAQAYDCDVHTCVNGTISASIPWATTSVPYVVNGDLTVASGVTLTINPGVVVKFATGTTMTVNGILDAVGTSGSKIIFTAINDDASGSDDTDGGGASVGTALCKHIVLGTNSSSTFTHANIYYGGGDFNPSPTYANVRQNGGISRFTDSIIASAISSGISLIGGTTTITNSEFYDQEFGVYSESGTPFITVASSTLRNHGTYGLAIQSGGVLGVSDSLFNDNGNGAASLDFGSGLSFLQSGNNRSTSGLRRGFIVSGSVTTTQTWGDGMPYIFNHLTIPTAKRLTLDPGVIVRFYATSSELVITGELWAVGSEGNEIYFTSIHDDAHGGNTDGISTNPVPGNWKHIRHTSGASTTMSHVGIYYGGADSNPSQSYANITVPGGTLRKAYARASGAINML